MEKFFGHLDFNNFYASVECQKNPQLWRVPMAVVGNPTTRHGIILAKNEIAKRMGIMTGESIFSARQKVPNLATVLADYPTYVNISKRTRELYRQYSNEVTPYGLDENWVSFNVQNFKEADEIADTLRERVKREFGLTVSVGLSFNYVFSKLGSDLAKRDSMVILTKNELQSVIWKRPAFELLFVGAATRKKLSAMGIFTIGDLAQYDVRELRRTLGKNGETLWRFANGDDSEFDPRVPEDNPFKSMGNSITLPYDLRESIDILTMFYVLSKTVSERLKKHKLKVGCVSILIKYSDFSSINRQLTADQPSNKEFDIYRCARRLFLSNFNKRPVRSVGIHVSKLCDNKYEQLNLFEENKKALDEIVELERNLQGRLRGLKVENCFNFAR